MFAAHAILTSTHRNGRRYTRDHDRTVLATNSPLEVIEDALNPDGSLATWLVTKFPFSTANGERFVGGVGVDITERKKADEALRESEERLRLLGDNLPNAMVYQFTFEPEGTPRFLYVSAGVEHLSGVKAEDAVKDANLLRSQIVPHQIPALLEAEKNSAHELSVFECEIQMQLPDGRLRWRHLLSRPRRLADGRVIWDGVMTDITERKQATEAWRNLSAIVESSYDAIIGRTLDGTITSWNPAAERLYGYSAAEMLGQSFTEFIPHDCLNAESDILRRVADREYIEDFETVRRRKDGSLVEVSLRVSPILDAGVVVGASSIARDISERKRLQEALLRSEKLAVTGRLAATIAHEVNNPLGAAMNAIYLATTTPALPSQAGEMLQLAERELRRAAHITQQTLGFYRDGGNNQKITAHDVVKEVLSVYATKLRNRNITVHYRHRCSSGSPREGCPDECKQCQKYLCVNAGELRQVISNLLANGIDALSDGGTMYIRTSRSSDRVRLTMADNGHGIRTESLKRIFEPFFTTKKDFGTGLGLWVTQELVRKYNGVIKVRSSEGKGTVFRMTFPQARTEDGVLRTASSTRAA